MNTSPTHAHHRYVINFRDYPLHREDIGESWAEADDDWRRELQRQPIMPLDYPGPVAADWPHLLAIVKEKVQPQRISSSTGGRYGIRWWHYAEKRPGLYASITKLDRVLVIPQTSNVQALIFLPTTMVFSHTLIVFPFTGFSAFSVLQSRTHQIWLAFLGPTMKDDLRYTPSDCFETFPFPERWETHPALEAAGKAYHDFRAALMVRNDEGMTRT